MSNYFIFIALIVLSAFFSGSETAFFSLNQVRLEKFKKKNRKALQIERLKAKPDYLLSSILLGNMSVNIAFSSLIAAMFIKLDYQFGIFFSIVTSSLVILIFGEILPKGFAIHTAERFALLSSYILKIFHKIVWPLCWLLISVSRFLFRLVFRRETKEEDILTEEELKEALDVGKVQGFIDTQEKDMIHSILAFSDIEASQILTPRTEVKAVDIESPCEHIDKELKGIKHSYVPVFREDIDEIVGVLRTKDFFLNRGQDIKSLIRPPFFIPETKNIGDLLRELIARGEKIALVVDEYGGFSGVVTLEDIQEEIFGEFYDEYEVPKKNIKKVKDKEFLVEADISLKDLNYQLNLELPQEEQDSLGGFILSLIERFPKEAEVIKYKNLEFIVERATKKRILRLKIKIKK